MDNSGKPTSKDDITPQSNYVEVYSDGECRWFPRYDHSLSQCPVDVTWFPFDEQKCELIFESWNLRISELELFVRDIDYLVSFLKSNYWQILGACLVIL